MNDMKIEFRKAETTDAEEQLSLNKSAFMPLYEKYHDEESPANMTLDKMRGKIQNPYGAYYVIIADGEAVGGIYGYPLEKNIMYLCSVYVKPEMQGKGIAQMAIEFLHSQFPDAVRWVLDVPESEPKNIHVYEKLGYKVTSQKEIINDNLTIATYIKDK